MENYFTKTNTLNYYILNESITKPQFFLSFFSSIYLIYVHYPSVTSICHRYICFCLYFLNIYNVFIIYYNIKVLIICNYNFNDNVWILLISSYRVHIFLNLLLYQSIYFYNASSHILFYSSCCLK